MSKMPVAQKNIAFIGSTGGCANAALVLALQNGYQCSALVRKPAKLTEMLLAAGVAQSTIDSNLHMVEGHAEDVAAMKATFSWKPCDMIVSGIGAVPFAKDMDWNICQKASRTMIAALDELQPKKKPALVCISTTGITDGARDVPLLWVPLYHVALKKPHVDKRIMEQQAVDAAVRPDPAVSQYTLVRPTLLVSSEPKGGIEHVVAGTEASPKLGYVIARKEVGLWIYEELIKGDETRWRNQKASLAGKGSWAF